MNEDMLELQAERQHVLIEVNEVLSQVITELTELNALTSDGKIRNTFDEAHQNIAKLKKVYVEKLLPSDEMHTSKRNENTLHKSFKKQNIAAKETSEQEKKKEKNINAEAIWKKNVNRSEPSTSLIASIEVDDDEISENNNGDELMKLDAIIKRP